MDKRRSADNKNKLLYDPNQREQRRLGAFSNEENYDEEELEEENESNEKENDLTQASNDQSIDNEGEVQSSGKLPIKQVVSNKAKQVASAAGAKAKAAAARVGAKIVAFIAANPWVLLILAALIILLIVIMALTGDDDEYGHFDELCDYNLAVVNLTTVILMKLKQWI